MAMTAYRGFAFFPGGSFNLIDNGQPAGSITLAANTTSENSQFQQWVDLLLDNPAFSSAFQVAASAQNVALRQFSIATGFDQLGSRFSPSGSEISYSNNLLSLGSQPATYVSRSGDSMSSGIFFTFIHELTHSVNFQFGLQGHYGYEVEDNEISLYEEHITIFSQIMLDEN